MRKNAAPGIRGGEGPASCVIDPQRTLAWRCPFPRYLADRHTHTGDLSRWARMKVLHGRSLTTDDDLSPQPCANHNASLTTSHLHFVCWAFIRKLSDRNFPIRGTLLGLSHSGKVKVNTIVYRTPKYDDRRNYSQDNQEFLYIFKKVKSWLQARYPIYNPICEGFRIEPNRSAFVGTLATVTAGLLICTRQKADDLSRNE